MSKESICERPKATDDDEVILRQQEEFFKEKQQPSVKIRSSKTAQSDMFVSHDVMRIGNEMKLPLALKKPALEQQDNGEVINLVVRKNIQAISRKKSNDMVQNIPMAPSHVILGNVMEKKFCIERYEFDENYVSSKDKLGFPKPFGFNEMKIDGSKSLFWRRIAVMKDQSREWSAQAQSESLPSDSKEEACIIAEDRLAAEIHEENMEKLAKMSKEEILREKKNLEKTLDSTIIQFLKNKRNKSVKRPVELDSATQTNASIMNETCSMKVTKNDKKIKISLNDDDNTKMDCEDINASSIPESPKKLLEESKRKRWLHMDTLEPEKFKWMEDLPMDKKDKKLAPNEEYNARFDFNGLLLPYKDESVTVNEGLHHHGEEPERPGYTLQELLQLCRSSAQQQRCMALTTLANIMEKTRRGMYDKILHPSPLIVLSQRNILLLLRFSLDDTSVAVITATLQALRAFLVSEADEMCLDRLYGFDNDYAEPTLTPQLDDKDIDSLKDHELVQLDAVATLVRSDFLLRVRYILSEVHPSPVAVMHVLEILIRIARHSHITALNISSTSYLLDTIINNFIPLTMDQLAIQDTVNNAYGVPMIKAIKLCRVLIAYGKKPVAQKLDNFKVIQAILTYVSSETGKKDDINLSIESLRLWRILLYYEVGLDSIAGAQLILVSQLQLLLSNHDIQYASELACEYAASLIAIANYEKTLKPNIFMLLAKWSTQLSLMPKITWGVMKLIAVTLSMADEISAFQTKWLSNQQIFSMLRSSSNLLSNYSLATDREPSCLLNLDILLEGGELQPIVSVNSCVPFFATVLNTFHNNCHRTEIRALLEQPLFRKYIRDLEATEWNLEKSWYSRMELYLLMAVAKAASLLGNELDNAMAQTIWKITIKLISTVPADVTDHARNLLRIALSSEKVNLEIITNKLAKLNLTSTMDQIGINLCTDAALLYERYVGLNEDWSQAAMPKDWLFLPLVYTYMKCKNNLKLQTEDKDSIVAILSLVLILPDLIERLSPSLRFSRLILVYLCDTVYLDKDVSVLLTSVLSDLLTKYHAILNFGMELPGLTSFIDLFTVLCEHFCSSSYGDDSFAMTLLVPVAQRHDMHYRKLLWSEHAGALRYLRLPPEKLVVPLKEYLYPEEKDISLIESYIMALIRGTICEAWCPIPYAIAVHHSAMYLKCSNRNAVEMRTQLSKLRDSNIANKLLQYEPPQW